MTKNTGFVKLDKVFYKNYLISIWGYFLIFLCVVIGVVVLFGHAIYDWNLEWKRKEKIKSF